MMSKNSMMLAYERINVVVSLTLIGLALYFVLDFPQDRATFSLLGSPVEIDSPRQWLMMVLLGALAMAGMHAVSLAHPNLPTRRLNYLATFWMLPGLLVVLATQTLGLAPTPLTWAVGLTTVGGLLWLTMNVELNQISKQPNQSGASVWPRLWQQLVGYTIALIFFIVIYQTRTRSALSASAILLISGMIALSLLRYPPNIIQKSWLYAVFIALGMGQVTWALNYWRTGALNAGLLLLLLFYLLVSLAQQQLSGTLSRRVLLEFGAIALAGMVVIINL